MKKKIAIAGKGGTGKTTLAGALARLFARGGNEVWAIDADSNPNLAATLGLEDESLAKLLPLPRTVLHETTDDEGKRKLDLRIPAREIVDLYSIDSPDRVKLMLMGQVGHAGAG